MRDPDGDIGMNFNRAVILIFIFTFSFGWVTTSNAGEPAWWTEQKRQCGVSVPYNTWVEEGSPCPGAGGGGGGGGDVGGGDMSGSLMGVMFQGMGMVMQGIGSAVSGGGGGGGGGGQSNYDRALELNTAGAKALDQDRDPVRAANLFEQSLQLAPGNAVIMENLRRAHAMPYFYAGLNAFVKEWDYEKAEKYFEQILLMDPDFPLVQWYLRFSHSMVLAMEGKKALRAGHFAKAEGLYEQALQLEQQNAELFPNAASTAAYEKQLIDRINQTRAHVPYNEAVEQARINAAKNINAQQPLTQNTNSVTTVGIPTKNSGGEWVCPPAYSQIAFNPARYDQPDGHFCLTKDTIPCGSPYKSWSCPADQHCHSDGSNPNVALCK